MAQLSDGEQADLIAASRAGDLDAFGRLMQAWEPDLRLWLCRYCPPGVELDEVIHQTFIASYRSLPRFEPGRSFPAWLRGIARRELAGEHRRVVRRYRTQGFLFSDLVASAQVRTAELAVADEDHREIEALRRCLEDLGWAERSLVRYRYEEGQGIGSIAKRLDCPEGTIKKRLHRIRERLRHCLHHRLRRDDP